MLLMWAAIALLSALAAPPSLDESLMRELTTALSLDEKRQVLEQRIAAEGNDPELQRSLLVAHRLLDALAEAGVVEGATLDAWLAQCLAADAEARQVAVQALRSPERLADPPERSSEEEPLAVAAKVGPRLPPRPEIGGTLPVAAGELLIDAELDNGVRLTVVGDPYLTRVAVVHRVALGSAHEGAGESGVAHLLEHLMFSAPAGSLWDFVDEVGGFANAFTTHDTTTYVTEVAPEHLPELLERERARFSLRTFPEELVRHEADVVADEIRLGQLEPGQRIVQALVEAGYQGHPYSAPIGGTEAEIGRVQASAVAAFAERAHRGGSLHVVAAGPYEPRAVLELLEAYADLPAGPAPEALAAADLEARRIRIGDAARRYRLKGVLWPLPPQASCSEAAGSCVRTFWADEVALRVFGTEGRGRVQQALSRRAGMLVPVQIMSTRRRSGGFVVVLGERRSAVGNTAHNVAVTFTSTLSLLLGGGPTGVLRSNPTPGKVRRALQDTAGGWLTSEVIDRAREQVVISELERTWSPVARALGIAERAELGLPLQLDLAAEVGELTVQDVRRRYLRFVAGKGVRVHVR